MTDEEFREIAGALRRAEEARETGERRVAELEAAVDQLITVLRGRDVLNEGHERIIARARTSAGRAVAPRVRLRVASDKYQLASPDVDCAALMPLCQARCCALTFELSAQDLDEGVVRWEIERPYLIRHEQDGMCTHLDRERGGCGVYAHRPGPCRAFDCRGDARVWLDFERRVPAPPLPGLRLPVLAPHGK